MSSIEIDRAPSKRCVSFPLFPFRLLRISEFQNQGIPEAAAAMKRLQEMESIALPGS
jgi:hypothetical protein